MAEIRLRALEPVDADLLYRVENDREAWAGSNTVAPYSRSMLRDYALNYNADPFAAGQLRLVAVNEENTPVGILDLYDISALHGRAFVGIYILPEQRRKGYGFAMIIAAIRYANDILNIKTLAANILEDNHFSQDLFHKAGFQTIATLPAWHFANGKYSNVNVLTLRQF